MSQTSYQAALPHDMFLLYQRLAKKSRFFLEKLFGGEFYEVIITVDSVRGAGEFERGEVVTNSGGNFASDQIGVRSDDGGADDVICAVGNEFNETRIEMIKFAGSGVAQIRDGFVIFTTAF